MNGSLPKSQVWTAVQRYPSIGTCYPAVGAFSQTNQVSAPKVFFSIPVTFYCPLQALHLSLEWNAHLFPALSFISFISFGGIIKIKNNKVGLVVVKQQIIILHVFTVRLTHVLVLVVTVNCPDSIFESSMSHSRGGMSVLTGERYNTNNNEVYLQAHQWWIMQLIMSQQGLRK